MENCPVRMDGEDHRIVEKLFEVAIAGRVLVGIGCHERGDECAVEGIERGLSLGLHGVCSGS